MQTTQAAAMKIQPAMKTMKKYGEMWKDAKREELSLTKEKEQWEVLEKMCVHNSKQGNLAPYWDTEKLWLMELKRSQGHFWER